MHQNLQVVNFVKFCYAPPMKLSDWLTQEKMQGKDFAKKIGKSPTMVVFLKKATRKPNAKLLARISKATNGQVTEADFEGAINEVGI